MSSLMLISQFRRKSFLSGSVMHSDVLTGIRGLDSFTMRLKRDICPQSLQSGSNLILWPPHLNSSAHLIPHPHPHQHHPHPHRLLRIFLQRRSPGAGTMVALCEDPLAWGTPVWLKHGPVHRPALEEPVCLWPVLTVDTAMRAI